MSRAEQSPNRGIEFSVNFSDNSTFTLPDEMGDVFVDGFGFDQSRYAQVAERLSFVTQKYFEHKSWPNEIDDVFWEAAFGKEALQNDSRFDDDSYYIVPWGGDETLNIDAPLSPDMAEIANCLIVLQLLPLILQKEAQELGSGLIVSSAKTIITDIETENEL